MSKIIVTLILSMLSFQSYASAVFQQSTGNFNYGPYGYIANSNSFDQAHFSFAATTTSSLDVTNFGGGFIDPSFHGPYPVVIDLWNGASWVNIFTSPAYYSDTNLSSILAGTINFASMTATELRLTSDVDHSWNFHNVSSTMTYTLNDSAPVPEPASLALLGLGLAGLGFSRRKKQKAA